MKHKALCNGRFNLPRRIAAAVVFAAALNLGCGEFPQCQVYFRGQVTQQCTGFLENMKVAKKKLREVDGQVEYTREKLRERVVLENNMEGLDTFNRACDELNEIHGKVARYKKLETKLKRGGANDLELIGVNEGIQDIIEWLDEIAEKLVSI